MFVSKPSKDHLQEQLDKVYTLNDELTKRVSNLIKQNQQLRHRMEAYDRDQAQGGHAQTNYGLSDMLKRQLMLGRVFRFSYSEQLLVMTFELHPSRDDVEKFGKEVSSYQQCTLNPGETGKALAEAVATAVATMDARYRPAGMSATSFASWSKDWAKFDKEMVESLFSKMGIPRAVIEGK